MTRRHFPHDMGGDLSEQDGSPVVPDFGKEPVFKEAWHGRALALTVLSAAHGKWNLDESRHMRECLPPEDYTRFSYYEKWLSGLACLLLRHGLVCEDELKQATASPQKMQPKTLLAARVKDVMNAGGPSARTVKTAPRFKIGDHVTTRAQEDAACVDDGHTRLPRYAACKKGVVVAHHGGHVLPDSNAHDWQTGDGEAPEYLYGIRFNARELFEDADPRDHVVVDCWERYLS